MKSFVDGQMNPNEEWFDYIPKHGHLASSKECRVLWEAILETDDRYDGAIQNLRHSWKESGAIAISTLKRERLNEIQQNALKGALKLEQLMKAVEKPYRAWVTGESFKAPSPKLWTDPGWKILRQWDPQDDLSRLRALAEPRSTANVIKAIHKHHCNLSDLRGSEPWEFGLPSPTRRGYVEEDFRLGVLSGLFEQGLGA
ncbi:MAG: hypothetical protein HKN10_15020 [Myxococcales bacterium]|nr:hypothetical protein [Myxococcales bacterium]